MPGPTTRERGSAVVEFAFAGVPLLFLLVVIFEICIAMWSYHTLATAVEEGAIYASTKGQGCTYTGNSCGINISAIVQDILSAGVGIDSSKLILKFHSSAAGSTDIVCNPASSCLSNTTSWPPGLVSSGPPAIYGYIPNVSYIDITATYPSPIPITSLFWAGRVLAGMGTFQFSATSRQLIQF